MRLIQVVPRLRPFDGVSDYALVLGRRLREEHALETVFVTAGTGERGSPGAEGFEEHAVSAATPAALVAALGAAGAGAHGVLLHYVGYGYARRGAPLWLARGVALAKQALGCRLGVVFHELFATGMPWNSSFWLSGWQRAITRSIAAACDWALVTREAGRQWLVKGSDFSAKPVHVMPMCSTVGESSAPAPASARNPVLVVWGGRAAKETAYGARWPHLRAACDNLGISRIVDIGPAAGGYPADGPSVEVRGPLAAGEISRVLLGARFGLVRYPASFLAKSTLYAAHAAHGVPVLLDDDAASSSLDGLEPGRHFLPLARAQDAPLPAPAADAMARLAHRWYEGHTCARHAQRVRAMLDGERR